MAWQPATASMDAPIELVLENNVLVAREFSLIEGADGESGVSVRCSDGSCSCYVQSMQPTEREFHDIKLPQRRMLYARKRALVIDQADLDPDNLPWVEQLSWYPGPGDRQRSKAGGVARRTCFGRAPGELDRWAHLGVRGRSGHP